MRKGGEFDSASAPGTQAFAALDPVTGAVDTSFDVQVSREWSNNAPRVHALEIHDDWLSIGGTFSHITGAGTRVHGYDLSGDGEPAVWVTSTSFIDTSPGAVYTIVAWGNGTNGTTATCGQALQQL